LDLISKWRQGLGGFVDPDMKSYLLFPNLSAIAKRLYIMK
jgi:hypothetical protein